MIPYLKKKKKRSLPIFKGVVYKISKAFESFKKKYPSSVWVIALHGEGSWLRFMRCQTKKSILTHKHLAEFWVWLPKRSPELDS